METGKAYILHCPDGHSWVGRVSRHLLPLVWEFEAVSKIKETNNGDVWHKLAAGEEELREQCTYAHHKTNVVLPLSIGAIEWAGETPIEQGLPETRNARG